MQLSSTHPACAPPCPAPGPQWAAAGPAGAPARPAAPRPRLRPPRGPPPPSSPPRPPQRWVRRAKPPSCRRRGARRRGSRHPVGWRQWPTLTSRWARSAGRSRRAPPLPPCGTPPRCGSALREAARGAARGGGVRGGLLPLLVLFPAPALPALLKLAAALSCPPGHPLLQLPSPSPLAFSPLRTQCAARRRATAPNRSASSATTCGSAGWERAASLATVAQTCALASACRQRHIRSSWRRDATRLALPAAQPTRAPLCPAPGRRRAAQRAHTTPAWPRSERA